MAQMGDIGPMLGQHHQFHHYNPGKSKFAEERYFNIAKRLYQDLDEHQSKSDFLAGKSYSIAEIANIVALQEEQIFIRRQREAYKKEFQKNRVELQRMRNENRRLQNQKRHLTRCSRYPGTYTNCPN